MKVITNVEIEEMKRLSSYGKTSSEISKILDIHRLTIEKYVGKLKSRKIIVKGMQTTNIDNSMYKKKTFLNQINNLEIGSNLQIISRGYSNYDRKPTTLEGIVFEVLKDKFLLKSNNRIYMFTILDFMGNDCKIV